jgi:hypothetical protein
VNEHFSNVIAGLTAAMMVAWVGMEVSRRRAKLREIFDVLGNEDRTITIALEQMVEDRAIQPYVPAARPPR